MMRLASGTLVVQLGHHRLNLDRGLDRRDDRGKLDEQPVAHGLDDAAAFLGDDRRRGLAARPHRIGRAALVLAHQPGIADDVDGHDCGEFSRLNHRVPLVGSVAQPRREGIKAANCGRLRFR